MGIIEFMNELVVGDCSNTNHRSDVVNLFQAIGKNNKSDHIKKGVSPCKQIKYLEGMPTLHLLVGSGRLSAQQFMSQN